MTYDRQLSKIPTAKMLKTEDGTNKKSYIKSSSIDDSSHVVVMAATYNTVITQPLATVDHRVVEGFWWNVFNLLS